MKRIQPVFLVLVVALWMPAAGIFLSLSGCAPGRSGLVGPLDPHVEHSITNTVTRVETVTATVAPQPYATAIEAGGAAVLALLAAWQGLTHSKLNKLETSNPSSPNKPTP